MRLLLFATCFISCSNFSDNNLSFPTGTPEISKEKLDTIKTRPYSVTTKPEIFETAFFQGTRAKLDDLPITFYSVDIGKLNIESGKLIACDPVVLYNAEPFLQVFPKGFFPIQLAIARIDNDERVAFSRIVFADSPIVKWEYALLKGQSQISIDSESTYGYGVDAGVGLFIDKEASEAFNSLPGKNTITKVFNDMDKHYRNTWDFSLYNFGGHNLAVFSSGYGDGDYSTYIGYDENGNVCRLLTDFGIVEWWKK